MTRIVAFGDSFTCGQGVGVQVAPEQTWVARLAGRLSGATVISLAAPGARLSDVRARQLPSAPEADLVTVMAGLNDVARAGFDDGRVLADLRGIVELLTARPPLVLLARLHDPSEPLSLPGPLRRLVRARVAKLNAAVDEVARHPAVAVFDLAAVPELRGPAGWAVDRVHPSAAGHAAIADEAARQLCVRGWPVREPPPAPPAPAEPRLAHARWCLRHGLPYALSHSLDFAAPVLTAWRTPKGIGSAPG